MFDTAPTLLAGVDAAVDQLLGVTAGMTPGAPGTGTGPLGSATPAELLTGLQRLQQITNLAAAAEQALLAHAVDTDAFEDFGAATVPDLLADQLHLRRRDAHTRVRRATQTGPRTSLTGQPLPPELPQLAAAQAVGAVSGDHVDVVTRFMNRLRPHTTVEQHHDVEAALVTLARHAAPDTVAAAGRAALDRFDPDGPAPRDLDRHRSLSARQRDDGSGKLDATLTPEALAKLQTLLSPLAAPRPQDDSGVKDTRSVGQRQHDAFEELLDRLLVSDGMPNHGGIPLTLIVMMDIDDLISRTGTAHTAHTAHGTTIPVSRLLAQAAELQIVPVITSKVDGIVAYGVNRRIASPGQALALIGRDRGCTFPGCHRPQQTNRLAVPETPHPRSRRRPRRNRPRQPRPRLRPPPPPLRPLGLDRRPHRRTRLVDTTGHRRPRPTTPTQHRPRPTRPHRSAALHRVNPDPPARSVGRACRDARGVLSRRPAGIR